MRVTIRRIRGFLSIMLALAVVFVTAQGVMAAKNKATTIRLVKTEGDVTIKNSSKGELSQSIDMRLYNGDHQITGKKSYAWMSLDDTKAVKLDEDSESELRKKGRKLEVLLDSGNMFFNVTVPLEKEESLNIRTSTMVTGVRGTCGWMVVSDDWSTRVYLLTGKLECVVTNPTDGQSDVTTIMPGTYVDFFVIPKAGADAGNEVSCRIESQSFATEEVPGFVLQDVVGDAKLLEKIYEESGVDLRGLTQEDVNARLARDQREHEEDRKRIRENGAKELSVVEKDPVWTKEGDLDDQNGIVYLTMPQKAETVQGYLNAKGVRQVTLLPGEGTKEENALSVDVTFEVPAGRILEAREGVAVNVLKQYDFTVNGTADLKDDLTNAGRLTVKSSDTLKVEGTFLNQGTFDNTATGHVILGKGMVTEGSFTNAGLIETNAASGSALITVKGGSFAMTGGQIISDRHDVIIEVASGVSTPFTLSGGVIANEKQDAAAMRVQDGNLEVEALGTDVTGVTDTLLGKDTDMEQYDAASEYREDGKYHLIAAREKTVISGIGMIYKITWKNENGSVLLTEMVQEGVVPSYTGKEPQKKSTDQFSFELAGWSDGEKNYDVGTKLPRVKGDETYTAYFKEATRKYKVKWVNEDGSALRTDTVEYGTIPSYKGTPTMKSDQYDCVFKSWTSGKKEYAKETALPEVKGDVTYKAKYDKTLRKYTVTWMNEGSVWKTDQVEYGSKPDLPGTPSKGDSYTFSGWSDGSKTYTSRSAMPAVKGDVTYYAQFVGKARDIQIRFLDENGAVLDTVMVQYGTIPRYSKGTPTKAATTSTEYTFVGWRIPTGTVTYAANLPEATKNADYYADFRATPRKYTYTFKNGDGATIHTMKVEYGSTPAYGGPAPTKTANERYSYTFTGNWAGSVHSDQLYASSKLPEVTGNETFTAQFSQEESGFTVTWKNYDGRILRTDSNVQYGTTPYYSAAAAPMKADDVVASRYSFVGWSDNYGGSYVGQNMTLPSVTRDVTYTAVFDEGSKNMYLVRFMDGDDSMIKDAFFEYGQQISFGGPDPTKFTYDSFGDPIEWSFRGWSTTPNGSITGLPTMTGTKDVLDQGLTFYAIFVEPM